MNYTKKRTRAASTGNNTYAAQLEKEGRRWCISVSAPSLSDAENWAAAHAGLNGYRHITTLPLITEV